MPIKNVLISLTIKNTFANKFPLCRRQCVNFLDMKTGFKPPVRHRQQNETRGKYFFGEPKLSKFETKTLRVK